MNRNLGARSCKPIHEYGIEICGTTCHVNLLRRIKKPFMINDLPEGVLKKNGQYGSKRIDNRRKFSKNDKYSRKF